MFETTAPRYMKKFIRNFNATVLDAAAVFGNAGHESGGLAKLQEIKPTVKGSRGGYGWFQWTGPRRRQFEAWCKDHGLRPSDDAANYGFLCHELQGSERGALNALKAAGTLEDKVVAFEKSYERAGVKHYPQRIAWAKRALKAYETQNKLRPSMPSVSQERPPLPPQEVTDLIESADKNGISTTNVATGVSTVAGCAAVANEVSTAVYSATDALTMLKQAGPWILLLIIIVGGGWWIWRERRKKRALGKAARKAVA